MAVKREDIFLQVAFLEEQIADKRNLVSAIGLQLKDDRAEFARLSERQAKEWKRLTEEHLAKCEQKEQAIGNLAEYVTTLERNRELLVELWKNYQPETETDANGTANPEN